MSLDKRVKTALDETRLLILGAQILLGFKLQATFQQRFAELPVTSRFLDCLGQFLMVLTIGLLIAPSMQLLIIEKGQATKRLIEATSFHAALALFPFAISVGLGLYIVFALTFDTVVAVAAGVGFSLLAGLFWYGIEWFARKDRDDMNETQSRTPLATKIEQMLTEARVILPGAQALLGFQLVVVLTRSFSELPQSSRFLHILALCLVAFAMILLMTPAALHRIAYGGEDNQQFFRQGSWFVVLAPIPLGLGIALDLYVTTTQASRSETLGATIALVGFLALIVLWYGLPLYLRKRAE
jgi:hypothetical protein